MTLLVKLNVTHLYQRYNLSANDFLFMMGLMNPEDLLEIEEIVPQPDIKWATPFLTDAM